MRQQFAWNFAAQAIGIILPPLLIIALARILEPSDFGVFALLSITIGALQAVSLGPLGEVIVKSDQEEIGNFIFTLQLMLGVVISMMLLASADYIAELFKKPELANPLRVSCLLFLVSPLVDTAIRLNMRRISFKAVFIRRVVTPVANAMISLPLAFYGAGFWALVWGQIGGTLAAGLVVLSMGGWRPRLNLDFHRFTDDLRFGWQMVLILSMRWTSNQSDKAILSYNDVSAASLGYYDMARRLAGIPFAVVVDSIAQVMYAVMADRIRRNQTVVELFMLAQRRALMITFPLCVILTVNAEDLIVMALGEKWGEISTLFTIFVIASFIGSVMPISNEAFKALGKPHIISWFMLARAIATLGMLLILAPLGMQTLALGILGLMCVFAPINVMLCLRLLDISARKFISYVLLRPAITAMVILAVTFPLKTFYPESIPATLLNLMISAVIMLAAGYYWERDLFVRFWK